MELIYKPNIFINHPEVESALSLRVDSSITFDMSFKTCKDSNKVKSNRLLFTSLLGFSPNKIRTLNQVHGDKCCEVSSYSYEDQVKADSMFTNEKNILLSITVADCIPILIFDPVNKCIAAIHSGWRGSKLNIVKKTINKLILNYNSLPNQLVAYIGASAGSCCYEIGEDVSKLFDPKFSTLKEGNKFLFDNKAVVLSQLESSGLLSQNIELDSNCTICNSKYHSFRRDGTGSGRMFASIGLK
jgi:YfiH family protein